MVSSFENITRRLDLNPATRDTTYDKTRSFGRVIKKIPYIFTTPAASLDPLVNVGVSCIALQYNYTAIADFRIIAIKYNHSPTEVFLWPITTIRYRVGTDVVRYRLRSDSAGIEYSETNPSTVQYLAYNQQIIKANFAIEYWITADDVLMNFFSLPSITYYTNLLKVPATVDETEESIEVTETLNRTTLAKTMPETLPTNYAASSSWLTN